MSSAETPERSPRPRRDHRKRNLALGAALLLVLGAMGAVVALSLTNLGTSHISLFTKGSAASNFTVTSLSSKIKGKDKVEVYVTLDNPTASAHAANVYVEIQNATTGAIANATQATGSVAAAGSVTLHYIFQGTNYATEFDTTFLSVHDTS